MNLIQAIVYLQLAQAQRGNIQENSSFLMDIKEDDGTISETIRITFSPQGVIIGNVLKDDPQLPYLHEVEEIIKQSKVLFQTTESICRNNYGDDDMNKAYDSLEKLL
jgi:hypothetical protein